MGVPTPGCKLEDIIDTGTFFTFGERSTKTRNGESDNPAKRRKCINKIFCLDGGEKVPYRALKEYISHRPESINTFYLQAIDSPKTNVWYKKVPLKKDGIASIMKNMTQIAKIDNKDHFSPTTGRKTAIQSLRNLQAMQNRRESPPVQPQSTKRPATTL